MRATSIEPRDGRRPRLATTAGARIVIPALLLCTQPACRDRQTRPSEGDREGSPPAVEAVQARFGSLPIETRLGGVVKAENQVAIHAEISAPIAAVLVRNGETVSRDQPLVRLEDTTLREQLRQAEANVRLVAAEAKGADARVDELRAQVVRNRQLALEALISDLELETQEARLAAAEAQAERAEAGVEQAVATLEERRTALAKTLVRAPISGRVGQRRAEVGMLADRGSVLFVIGNLERLIVEVPLTESMLAEVREGQPVRVTSPVLDGETLRSTLDRVSPFLAAGSFSTVGEIDLDNPGDRLRPGMFVTVDILHGDSAEATLIPASALWEDPATGAPGVFVVGRWVPSETGAATLEEAGTVELRTVEVLAEGRSTVGLRGLEPGEWAVTVGHHLLASDERSRARVRRVEWERVLELQSLQREDLVRGFLEKQQRLAKSLGAVPPTAQSFSTGHGELAGGG